MAYANNIRFLKTSVIGTVKPQISITLQYEHSKKIYKTTISEYIKSEVPVNEIAEDFNLAIKNNDANLMAELFETYTGRSRNAIDSLIMDNAVTYNKAEEVGPIKKESDGIPKANNRDQYYLLAYGWNMNNADKLASLTVVLKDKEGHIENVLYKYPRGGYEPNMPSYMNLHSVRDDIYNLRDAGQYEKAHQYFRNVFKKDPITGADIN